VDVARIACMLAGCRLVAQQGAVMARGWRARADAQQFCEESRLPEPAHFSLGRCRTTIALLGGCNRRSQLGQQRMEPLWSPVVATSGNPSQIAQARKPRDQAKTVAVDCDRLPETFHGKEGVDGSSPSEGSAKAQQMLGF
jgi:hypothetical protein